MLKISYVKHGYGELDVRIVPDTFDRREPARLTERALLCCTLCVRLISFSYPLREGPRTRRLSSTPSLTGSRSAAVYRSRCVTSNSETLTVSWLLRMLNWSFLLEVIDVQYETKVECLKRTYMTLGAWWDTDSFIVPMCGLRLY